MQIYSTALQELLICFTKMCFKFCFKIFQDGDFLISDGNFFHSFGIALAMVYILISIVFVLCDSFK